MKTLSILVMSTLVLAAGLVSVSDALAGTTTYSMSTLNLWIYRRTTVTCTTTISASSLAAPSSSLVVGLSPAKKKRSTETIIDMIDMGEKEKKYMEDNSSVDGFFRAVDTDCDGYLDSCEWNKLDSGVREFMDVLGYLNSTDDLVSLEEFQQLDPISEVKVMMLMPMDDVKMMMEDMAGQDEDNDGGDDDGPKDRKRPDGGNP